jgi:hypothetical protein
MAQRDEQPGGLDQQFETHVDLERLVAGDDPIARDGIGDIGVDVEGGGAGRPVAGALLAADGAPGERRSLEPYGLGARPREVDGVE